MIEIDYNNQPAKGTLFTDEGGSVWAFEGIEEERLNDGHNCHHLTPNTYAYAVASLCFKNGKRRKVMQNVKNDALFLVKNRPPRITW